MSKLNFDKSFSFRQSSAGFLLLGIFAIMVVVFFSSESIRAQMMGLYDQKNDDVVGITALMSAVSSNDITGVKFFSKASALVNQRNVGGATALHIACREKNLEIAKILIASGADLNIADNEGWTPLMRASLAGDKDIVDLLLTKGVRADEINSARESAIIHAALSDCVDCLNLMFTKFNFIRSTNITFLQGQLTEAFIIAKNHDNQAMQVAIEAYLDRVIKMMSLVENIQKKVEGSSQVFKITSSEEVVKPVPMLAKETPATDAVTTRFKLKSDEVKQQKVVTPQNNKFSIKKSIEPQAAIQPLTIEPQKIVAPQKDFKFLGQVKNSTTTTVTTPQAKAPSKSYVVVNSSKSEVVSNQVPDQAKNKMMIYLIKKNDEDSSKTLAPQVTATPKESGKSVFKLISQDPAETAKKPIYILNKEIKSDQIPEKSLKKPLQREYLIDQQKSQY